LKKPNSSANRKNEADNLFQIQQGSTNTQNINNTGNLFSIDDLLGGPVNINPVQFNNQNNNNNNVFDSNMFGAPANNNTNNNGNNIVDFDFVVNKNNNNNIQAQNSNANTDLFGIGNASIQAETGGFNTDDLLKSILIK
jgi:hypothetical protein